MTSPLAATVHPFPSGTGRDPAHHAARLHDAERLRALERSELMDSPAEDAFDRAVRLATRLLGTPVGLLSLVDGERQFFKAQLGLPEPTATARQTPLSHSFCQHVVNADAPLAVRDARADPRVRGNLAIEELDVIAYLGVPVHAPDGAVLGSFCAIQSEPREWTDVEREALEDIAAGVEAEIALRTELKRSAKAEARASTAEEHFRLALHAGQVGTYDYDPVADRTRWDDELFGIWGVDRDEPDLMEAATRSIHIDDKAAWEADVTGSLDLDGPGRHDLELRIVRPDTGAVRWVHATGQASFVEGRAVRMVGTVRDVTERKNAESRERLLTRELNHRVKNLFAVVAGMIGLTARTAATPKAMAAALRSRVQALASAHALIQPAITGETIETADVTLQTLAAAILEPHMRGAADAVTLSGPPVPLKPNVASSLALVLHELATNAAKYGALSTPDGRLAIEWSVERDDDGQRDTDLRVTWSETGGPTISAPPDRKGFGSTLIDMTVRGQMNGSIHSEWDEKGVRHDLRLPLDRLR